MLVVHVVGARPNYMKVAPLYTALAGSVEQRLIHTGQHYDAAMKDVFFAELPLPPPHFEINAGSGSHGEQTARVLVGVERILVDLEPDLVVVAGDVNSTLAAALAAVKLGIPVCHIEAGLRSFDLSMPEEHNRRLTDHLSSLLFTHSKSANDNLAAESATGRVAFVGNLMVDTLFANLEAALTLKAWRRFGFEESSYVLVTLHRPALVDDPGLFARTVASLRDLSRSVPVIFPVHPRVARPAGDARFVVCGPLPYREFLSLEAGAAGVVTDSGGVQEETTALGVPCFTLRRNTERPVTVTQGTNVLLGLTPEAVLEVPRLVGLHRPAAVPELWDGHAGERAAAEIMRGL